MIENDTDDNDGAEWVTLGEAAARLDVDGGSLRRWAKRPHIAGQFEGRTRAATRATRTGTRAATLYPFTLVSLVWLASREGEPVIVSSDNAGKDAGDNEGTSEDRDTDAGEDAGGGTVLVADQLTRAYLAMMTQELRERVAEQAATIADLRQDKKDLQERVRQLEGTASAEIQNSAPGVGEPLPVQTTTTPRPWWQVWGRK